jgi:hypothetical protein
LCCASFSFPSLRFIYSYEIFSHFILTVVYIRVEKSGKREKKNICEDAWKIVYSEKRLIVT